MKNPIVKSTELEDKHRYFIIDIDLALTTIYDLDSMSDEDHRQARQLIYTHLENFLIHLVAEALLDMKTKIKAEDIWQADQERWVEILRTQNEQGEAIEELVETIIVVGPDWWDSTDWYSEIEMELVSWCSEKGFVRDHFDWQLVKLNRFR